MHLTLAIAATVLSAAFFVAGKVVIARGVDWRDLWAWSLTVTGLCGLVTWLALGAPAVPWGWFLAAGLSGAFAHVAANLALRWGDASVLVPISGAKPVALIVIAPLFGDPLRSGVAAACWLATIGIALVGLSPRRVHLHAPRPGGAFLLMLLAMVLMALSDQVGSLGMRALPPERHAGGFAAWNMALGLVPACALPWRRPRRGAGLRASAVIGVLFAVFIATIAAAFATASDPHQGVAQVNVIVAARGLLAIAMVVAIDHFLKQGLEPVPRSVHLVRALGAAVLAGAVWLAYRPAPPAAEPAPAPAEAGAAR